MADASHRPPLPSGPPLGGDRPIVYRRRPWYVRHRTVLAGIGTAVVLAGGTTAAVLATRNYDTVPAGAASVDASLFAPSAPPASTPRTAPVPVVTVTAPPRTTAKGKVVAVIAPGRWTISVEQGLQLTVVATPTTTYARHRTVDDVHKGSTITAVGTMAAGIITATSVAIEKPST
ncbi:hypothetical protein ACXR2U_18220 [Jatrophihabitans sp. YIM 134969]